MIKDWTNSAKIQSRKNNIIDYYRYFFKEKLPEDRQYWTLCGECVENGNLKENSEPDQMIKSGLISPKQFFGVEKQEEIFKINSTCNSVNFLFGDFFQKIIENHNQQKFNPAIINCDFLGTYKTELPDLFKILYLLSRHDKYYDILVSANFSRIVYKINISEDDLISKINNWNNPISLNEIKNIFNESGRSFEWAYTGEKICSSYKNGVTTMSTFNFIIRKK